MDDPSLAGWLRLREAPDHASRSVELTQAIVDRLRATEPVRVLDLGTGAGSNLRYLVPKLPPRQRWTVIDRSQTLLSELLTRTSAWAAAARYTVKSTAAGIALEDGDLDCQVETRAQDLAVLEPRLFDGCQLVTASALLDLVSASWLQTLAAECRRAGAAALFAITYDGRSTCRPPEPEDELVRGLLNQHQGRDKGLGGPAEGPRAAACAEHMFTGQGYEVKVVMTDWVLGARDAAMQRTLIDGWAEAAGAIAPQLAATIASWRTRRLAHVDAGRSAIIVGHRDLAAWQRGQVTSGPGPFFR
jgi:hypothetical protein